MEQRQSASVPKRPRLAGWITAVLLYATSPSLLAQEFLCEATQASSNELPVLAQSCPIGDGLWGKKAAKSGEGDYFWIQCGILNQPMPLAKAKPLYKQITTDVWMKPENKGFRCLIGPYSDFAQANNDLRQVKQLADYRDAFIRMVKPNATSTPVAMPKPQASVPPATPLAKAAPKAPVTAANDRQPAPVTLAQAPLPRGGDSSSIDIRKRAELKGRTYVVPYLLDDEHQFYMEHNQAWNRLDYGSAEVVCEDLQMRLATDEEFLTLLDSKIMENQQWPMQLPYWGRDRKGFFTDGRVTQVKGTSLLNVLCVK